MDSFGEHWIREKLANRLQPPCRPLPRSRMSPSLSYGRHRGPWTSRSRHAAVLIAIFRDQNDQWTIPLTRRPESLKHHGGQICLPGGQLESGESPVQAAMREFHEELGLQPRVLVQCGELDTQYVYNSDNRVHPVVALIQAPKQSWKPDPIEVADVIHLPLRELLHPSRRGQLIKNRHMKTDGKSIGGFQFRASMIEYQGQQIWGATAVILDQFAQVLSELGIRSSSEPSS